MVHSTYLYLTASDSIFWGEDGALNPLLLDVVSKIAEGLGLCLNAEAHEHRSDLVVREEREGHEFPDEPVRCFIVTVYSLEAKLLHLKKLKFVPLRKTYD